MPPQSGYGRYPVGMHFVTSDQQRNEICSYAKRAGISVGEAIRRLVDAGLEDAYPKPTSR